MSNPLAAADRRFSPRDWSLRVKLIVVLLVPALLALVLGVVRVVDLAGQAADFGRVTRFAAAQGKVDELIIRLQDERLSSTLFVAGGRGTGPSSLPTAVAAVDAATTDTATAVRGLFGDDPDLVGVAQQSEQAMARLGALRALVRTSNAPPSAIVSRFSDVITQLSQLDDRLLRGVSTSSTAGLTTAVSGLTAARNEASLQIATLSAAAGTTEPATPALAELAAGDARLAAGLAAFRAPLDAGERMRYTGLIAGASNTARESLVRGLLARGGALPLAPAVAEQAAPLYGAFLKEISLAGTGVRDELTAATDAQRRAAIVMAWVVSLLLVLAVLIGVVVVGLVARSMLTSLRTLRGSALDVAQNRLPEAVRRMREGAVPDVDVEPVPITTREEIGEVARAFDAVHTQAVRLAAEQATLQNNVNSMFINLSRRSQTLVDRQLQLIEELESNEQDPDQLSHLFRLDHLATRMRRNSENLLVLAGTDLAKRTSRRVPIVDVLRAAVGEIERYERIIVEQPPQVVVVGQAASDLQHLLAELLDNATSFSPPETQVVMSTRQTGDGAVIVEIADQGVGLRPDELAEANSQLGRRGEATVNASRRMGLFVVGRLAARHGVHVRLSGNSFGEKTGASPERPGITARVTVPLHLINVVPEQGRGLPDGRRHALPAPRSFPPQPAPSGSSTQPAPAGPFTPHPAQASPSPAPSQASPGRPGPGRPVPPRPAPPAVPEPTAPEPEPLVPSLVAALPRPREAQPIDLFSNGDDPATESRSESPAESRSEAPAESRPTAETESRPEPRPRPGTPPTAAPPGLPAPVRADADRAPVASPTARSPRPDAARIPAPAAASSAAATGAAATGATPATVSPHRYRSPLFVDPSTGWTRSYRPVAINWQPDPTTGAIPDDLPAPVPVPHRAAASSEASGSSGSSSQ